MLAAAPADARATPARIGRFELLRVLGRGAQATVWLAHDARLDREVALKLIAVDDGSLHHWLDEARSVSRLTHPNIVPVFEAEMHGRQPYLVFEYVAGPTLARQLRDRGAMPAHEAVVLMLGVLDALATAHAAGVVHRDLKPSNILVDAAGRARVMDFGIAARVTGQGGAGAVVGTPGYMSPEAVDGGAPAEAMDVFSAGLVLGELLSGRRLIAEVDPYRAMSLTVHEDVRLPEGLSSEVDAALRALLLRAIARDPAQRWPSAAAFREALRHWLAPPALAETQGDVAAAAAGAVSSAGGNATLEFLLRRMRHKSDFPALSDSIVRIRRVASSENESLASLSNEILKDVALTQKLLRLVNTAYFSGVAGGGVSTVSRAVALIGFAGIRNLATSLVLLEHLHDKAQAGRLHDEFLRALTAGTLAGELSGALHRELRDGEEAFIGAMFQNLGRLLAEFYLPEEAAQVRSRVAAADEAGRAPLGEDAAAAAVLGIGFEALGAGVARSWGLPPALQRCLRKSGGEPPARPPESADEHLRWVALTANRITDALLAADPAKAAAGAAQIARSHGRAIGLSAEAIEAATDATRRQMAQLAQAMGMQVAPQSPMRRLFATAVAPAPSAADLALEPLALQATITLVEARPRTALEKASDLLAAGIQDITNTLVENFRLDEVLRMILETIYRALGFQRIVFCLRDAKTATLTGRFGLGADAAAVAAAFKVPLASGGDLFGAVCAKGADTVIRDAGAANIAARLPAWYRQKVDAPAFLLLPLLMKGKPFGLIYADMALPGGIELGEKELRLVRTLRNQAVMAFKQQG